MLIVCSGSVLLIEILLPKTMAYRKDGTSRINKYLVEDQRTRTTKQNYLLQRDMEGDVLGDTFDMTYPAKPAEYEPTAVAEQNEVPALIVDYANMIRNDFILLDNSVETRTRKRGNIKVEKYNVSI